MIQLRRYKKNPILNPNPRNKWESKAVFNPGAVYKNGKVYLLYRAIGEYKTYISRLGLALSKDGFNFKRISKKPLISPSKKYDKWACEDPRITLIDNTFYITYVGHSQRVRQPRKSPPQTILLSTKDFIHFKWHGIITPKDSDNRDTVIFPEKINGKFMMIHRPHRWSKNWFKNPLSKKIKIKIPVPYKKLPRRPGIWIAYSYDLKNWTGHKLFIRSTHEEDEKIGAGAPPIKTEKGWLFIYHHVERNEKNERFYTAKAALLDLKNPSKIIAKIPYPILKPKTKYELKGDVDNVVFPTGAIVKDGVLFIYYGAADKRCAVATIKLEKILKELLKYKINGI